MINGDLLGLIIEVLVVGFLDLDSHLVDAWFDEDLHVNIVEEGDSIIVTILVGKGVFGWQFLENWLDEGLEVAVGDDVFGIHHVNLVSVHYLEEHKTFTKNDYIMSIALLHKYEKYDIFWLIL